MIDAKEIYLNGNRELYAVTEDGEAAFRFTSENITWEKVERDYSWKMRHKTLTSEEADEVMSGWVEARMADKHRLNSAIEFATRKHSGQFRKSTAIPYILHPLEVMQILYSMRADTDLMIAGVLHDTVEDTDATLDEITEIFGEGVANLVASNSEDKSKSWKERKQHTITEVEKADVRVKALVLADKLSNMRSLAIDYRSVGDNLWDRFNAPKEGQAWYYGSIQDSLWEMQNYPETEAAYWEFVRLYKDVFVEFYLDEERGVLFQSCTSGTVYCLEKGNPRWRDVKVEQMISEEMENLKEENPRFFDVNLTASNAQRISRKDAELMEDIWNRPFWDCNKNDMSEGVYQLYRSKKRNIRVEISRGRLSLMCEDYGKECLSINGSEEYEFLYSLNEDSTKYFLVQLRIKNGIEDETGEMLKKEFGKDSGTQEFKDYCDEIGVKPEFYSR